MQIYFETEFSECTLKVNTLDLNSKCKPLKDKCKTIKLNSNDLLSFLENLGTYLDLVNDGHDNFNPVSQQVNEKLISSTKKKTLFPNRVFDVLGIAKRCRRLEF